MKKKIVNGIVFGYLLMSGLWAFLVDFEVVMNPKGMGTNITWFFPVRQFLQWWTETFDPLAAARPTWYWTFLCIEAVFFGPYGLAGAYFFVKDKKKFDKFIKHWITKVYLALMFVLNFVVITEEAIGTYPAKNFWIVFALLGLWVIGPIFMIFRMRMKK